MKTFKATHLQYIFVVFVFLGVHIFSEAKYTIYNEDECDEKEEGADVGKCIECEIKKMSSTSLKLSQATIDHFGKDENLKVKDKHKKDNLQIFHCRCLYRKGEWLRGTFEDDYTSARESLDDQFVDDDDEDWGDWKKSEVLKISDCNELKLTLEGAIQTEMGQTVLMVENVNKLEMDFSMEAASNRFSSVYFRNVTFSEEYDNQMVFGPNSNDATELMFDTINITKGTFTIEQQNSNIDPESDDKLSVDPMLTITNSTFGSDYYIESGELTTSTEFTLKIQVANIQKDKDCVKKVTNDDDDDKEDDCGEEGCFFDYMGQVKITNNRFTYLDKEAITILNAKVLDFYGNIVEINMDDALYVANIKTLNISRNRFEFVGMRPALQVVYKYSATDLDSFEYFPASFPRSWTEGDFEDKCDNEKEAKFASMKADDIKDVNIMKNWFGKLHRETIKFKIDETYEKDFAVKKFTPEETANRRPCKCPIPKPEDDDDDELINDNLTLRVLNKQRCLSPRFPPVLGNRVDICAGKYPKSLEDRLDDAENGIKAWHLILAIILSIILTAVIVFVIVRFCCQSEESKSRTVSPIP